MTAFRNMPIRLKLMLVMAVTSTLSLLIACVAFVIYDYSTFRTMMTHDLATLASVIGTNCTAALEFGNEQDATETLSALEARTTIVAAYVYGQDGKLFASYTRDQAKMSAPPLRPEGYRFGRNSLDLYQKIQLKKETVGTICLRSDLQPVRDRLRQYEIIIGAMLFVCLLSALLLSSLFQGSISDPIRRLAAVASKVTHDNDYSLRATRTTGGETGSLTDTFNGMLSQIERQDEALRSANEDLENRVQLRTSELTSSQKSLQMNLSLLEATLEATTDGILVVDEHDAITSFNQQFVQLWQIPDGLLDERQVDPVWAYCLGLIRNAGAFRERMELLGIQPDADSFDEIDLVDGSTFEVSPRPQRIGARSVGRVWSFRDITDRKRSQEAVALQARELARSNTELEQFAYIASHDLQEPLRMVASYTQLLARRYTDRLDSDANEFIGYAVDGASRMQKLLNDLLMYSRVGTRGKSLEPTDCGVILQQSLQNLKIVVEEAGALVTHDPLPAVMGDPVQLTQVFQNLIANAIKFRRDERPRVHVSAAPDGEMWRLAVQDNGIGVLPEYFERIFVVFQRLHAYGEYPGTGIGLAVCKKIVERHGGRIWLESTPGAGSTFFFTMPAVDGPEDEQRSRA